MKANTASASGPPPPVSLGKPSLRHRLESYYSLVAPDAIANRDEWARKFDIIYNKYGGCHDKETKLANKLANKYGRQVRLLVAPPHSSMRNRQQQQFWRSLNQRDSNEDVHDEQHYKIDHDRMNSKILDFTSPEFDPFYALTAPERLVTEANAFIFPSSSSSSLSVSKLDNISKFRALLPKCDPQRLDPSSHHSNKPKSDQKAIISDNNNEQQDGKKKQQQQRVPMFLAMTAKYEHKSSGPLSLLYSILSNRQRVRVMVRYIDCIRGTLTGYLIAFDKHFNMILKDVDEVYGSRVTRDVGAVEVAGGGSSSSGGGTGQRQQEAAAAVSKPTLEAQRRRCYPKDGSGGPGPSVKQRYFNQLMVRGDNVVMVWKPEAERSMHPHTNKSPAKSSYATTDPNYANGVGGVDNCESRIGTPGSLYYALQKWQSQNNGNGRKRHS